MLFLFVNRADNYRGRADDPDCLDRSRELESVELEFESLSRENRLLRAQKEQALEELQTDNTVMKEKVRIQLICGQPSAKIQA